MDVNGHINSFFTNFFLHRTNNLTFSKNFKQILFFEIIIFHIPTYKQTNENLNACSYPTTRFGFLRTRMQIECASQKKKHVRKNSSFFTQ